MTPKNMAASVHDRLRAQARQTGRPFQEVLQLYAMERFLYRLSRSSHSQRFVLKGALMLRVWDAPTARPTKDVDLLGKLDNSPENLAKVVREICATQIEPDGLVFNSASIETMRIKEDADYEGVRVQFEGLLGKAKAPMQLDVGFGDATFANRKTTVEAHPVALTAVFSERSMAETQWQAFLRKGRFTNAPKHLADAVVDIAASLPPVASGIVAGDFKMSWAPSGPWSPRD